MLDKSDYLIILASQLLKNFDQSALNFFNFLQLNLFYDGRKSPSNKAIHTGSMQLRAYF
jgi:hypothetical protein